MPINLKPVAEKKFKLNIWDTAGQERFKTITSTYYKGSNGILLVYDITDEETFNNIPNWLEEVKKHAGPNTVKYLVGNTVDLEDQRKISAEQGKKLAESHGMSFMETSAKTKVNIDAVFNSLTRQIYEAMPEEMTNNDGGIIDNKKKRKRNRSGCCN